VIDIDELLEEIDRLIEEDDRPAAKQALFEVRVWAEDQR
jgi:hypothetical protein